MTPLRQYLIAVTAAAIICGITKCISGEKTVSGAILRLMAGIVMTVTVLSPVVQLNLKDLPALSDDIISQAKAAATIGTEMTREEINAVISERTEAYILDKAAGFGASLEVEICMAKDGSYRPETIILYGSVAPYAKSRLQSIIEEDIQIAKENQQWIG